MSINIGGYEFDGPYTTIGPLEDRSGVYAILCPQNGGYRVVDVGESATVRSRVENHDRASCWRGVSNALSVAARYTPGLQQSGRQVIEQALRAQFNPPCGDR